MTPTVETIWENFASHLRSFIRARVRDHTVAEDILQDVFVKIHRKLPTLKAGERSKRGCGALHVTLSAITFAGNIPAELGNDIDGAPAIPDFTPCVRRFVEELNPAYRDALVLTEWQGVTQEQMAKQ